MLGVVLAYPVIYNVFQSVDLTYFDGVSDSGGEFLARGIRLLVAIAATGALIVLIVRFLSNQRTTLLEQFIAEYFGSGPFSVAPAEVIPKDDFLDWRAEHPDKFITLPENARIKDMTVRDLGRYLTKEADQDALLKYRKFGFRDELRFRHQFIVGGTGQGKTTYLSNQINHDLERMKRGECCVFVMSSKNEDVEKIARLQRFAEGGDLEGKLLYIEPSPELALNIFEVSRLPGGDYERRAMNEVLEIIQIFMGSIVHMDPSGHQESLLNYAVPAVLQCPEPTIYTLLDLLSSDTYPHLRKYFANNPGCADETRALDRRLLPRPGNNKAPDDITVRALRDRVEAIVSHREFRKLFRRPKSSFDLYEELQKPQLILVNTTRNELKAATAHYGSFFMAKLMQAALSTKPPGSGPKLPVFAYVDEGNDYFDANAGAVDLLRKSRDQNVSMTVALHSPEELDSKVLGAFRQAAIQAFNGNPKRGTWGVRIGGGETVTLSVPPFDFGKELQISYEEFSELRRAMRERFAAAGADLDEPVEDARSYPPLPPESETTDADFEIIPPEKPKPAPRKPKEEKVVRLPAPRPKKPRIGFLGGEPDPDEPEFE